MTYFKLRIKTLICDKTTVVCFALSVCVITALLFGFKYYAKERSSVPVGLIDMDNSELSVKLVNRIKSSNALFVYEGDFDYLYELMTDGFVNSILVINENYGEKVRNGLATGLIRVYAAADNKIATVIQDIVAGAMMDDICLNRAYITYSSSTQAPDSKIYTFDDYSTYVDREREDELYGFDFDITFRDEVGRTKTASDVSNDMLYRQMIALMLSMLIMLLIFCANNVYVLEKESGIAKRLKTGRVSGFILFLEDNAGALMFVLPALLLVSFLFGADSFIKLMPVNVIYAVFMSLIFSTLARFVPSPFSYRFIGTSLIIVLSIFGFISVFEGFLGVDIFASTPSALYIRKIVSFGG